MGIGSEDRGRTTEDSKSKCTAETAENAEDFLGLSAKNAKNTKKTQCSHRDHRGRPVYKSEEIVYRAAHSCASRWHPIGNNEQPLRYRELSEFRHRVKAEYWNDGGEILEIIESVEVVESEESVEVLELVTWLDGVSGEFVVNRQ